MSLSTQDIYRNQIGHGNPLDQTSFLIYFFIIQCKQGTFLFREKVLNIPGMKLVQILFFFNYLLTFLDVKNNMQME